MQFSRLSLRASVGACLPGIDRNLTILQGVDAIIFTGTAIHSYNDSIAVSSPFESGLHGSIKATEFHKLLTKMPDEIVDIEVDSEANTWKVSSGKITATFALSESKILPHLEALKLDELAWDSIPDDFVSGLKLCIMLNNTSPFKGVYVNGDVILSTDSVRINRYVMSDCDLKSFWIDDKSASEIIKFDSIQSYAISEGWAHFRGEDGTILSTRRRDDEGFPIKALNKILSGHEAKDSALHNILPTELASIIERASIFGQELKGMSVVQLGITQDQLIVSADRNMGSYEECIKWEKSFDEEVELQVWVDSLFLQEAVSKVRNFYVKLGGAVPILVFHAENYMQLAHTLILPKKAEPKAKKAKKA